LLQWELFALDKACEQCAELAHDVNNLLAVILSSCELLEDQPGLSQPAKEALAQLQSAARSARSLSENSLALIRKEALPTTSLDLNHVVKRMQSMLADSIGNTVQLTSCLAPRPMMIRAVSSQVEQVLLNLLTNARDAMPQGGTVTVETAETRRGVMLAVTDTGTGMDAETLRHIFEPLFTTKPADQGTGLGLSIVSGILERAGWAKTVESSLGSGTTFKIYFPACEPLARMTKKSTETVLLVDDCDPLRTLTRHLLEDCGYRVLAAGSAAEALALAHEHRGSIPLLITDLSMPGLSGNTLAHTLAETRPRIRILYTSGFNDGSLGADNHNAFLQKPFSRDELLAAVRCVLDAPPVTRRSGKPPRTTTQNAAPRYSAHRLCG
jgi:two-component system, cell cycle sensor histidine kinase and response regulator CckA